MRWWGVSTDTALLGPGLVWGFLNHVMRNWRHYSYNVAHGGHVVISARHFHEYLRARGIEVERRRATKLFTSYVLTLVYELRVRGVVKEYWVEKGSRNKPLRVHMIISNAGGA